MKNSSGLLLLLKEVKIDRQRIEIEIFDLKKELNSSGTIKQFFTKNWDYINLQSQIQVIKKIESRIESILNQTEIDFKLT